MALHPIVLPSKVKIRDVSVILKGYSLSRGEIAVDIRLNVNCPKVDVHPMIWTIFRSCIVVSLLYDVYERGFTE